MKKLWVVLFCASTSFAQSEVPALDMSAVRAVEDSILKLAPVIESASQELELSFQKLSEACEAHSNEVQVVYKKHDEAFRKEMNEFQDLMNNGKIAPIRLQYLEASSGLKSKDGFREAIKAFFSNSSIQDLMKKMVVQGYVFSINGLPLPEGAEVDQTIWNGFAGEWNRSYDGSYPANILITKPIFSPQKNSFQKGLAFQARWNLGSDHITFLSATFPTPDSIQKRKINYMNNGFEAFINGECKGSWYDKLGEAVEDLTAYKETIAEERAKQVSGVESKQDTSADAATPAGGKAGAKRLK